MSTLYEKDVPAHAENASDTECGSRSGSKPKHGDMALALVGDGRVELTEDDVSATTTHFLLFFN